MREAVAAAAAAAVAAAALVAGAAATNAPVVSEGMARMVERVEADGLPPRPRRRSPLLLLFEVFIGGRP
jgi:hypothetical protein